jgi:hypothetical protein
MAIDSRQRVAKVRWYDEENENLVVGLCFFAHAREVMTQPTFLDLG